MDTRPGEHVIFQGHPSWRAILSFYLKGLAVAVVLGALGWLIGSPGLGIAIAVALFAVAVVVGFVKRIATTYAISNQRLRIRRGIISRNVQETRVDRIQNVNTDQGVIDRVLQVGTVDFDTAGTDDADFAFAGVAQREGVQEGRAGPARGLAGPGPEPAAAGPGGGAPVPAATAGERHLTL